MGYTNKGTVLIYVLFLLNIAVIMALVVFNNSFIYNNNIEGQNLREQQHTNIYEKSDIVFKLAKSYNLSGSGFIDNISCPNDVVMSGSVNRQAGINTTLLYETGSVFCQGNYFGDQFNIFFDATYSKFVSAYYKSNGVVLVNGVAETNFGDSDNTLMTFTHTGLGGIDQIDDDLNSDNYRTNSTGTVLTGTVYPGNYQDDDVRHRTKIYGFIAPTNTYKNIYWLNKEVRDMIDSNENNYDNLNERLPTATGAHVLLNIDNFFDIKIVELDKPLYESNKILKAKNIYNGSNLLGYGYIKYEGGELFIGENKSGNEFVFDFQNKDYAFFVKNISGYYLSYNMLSETLNGKNIYITPINDNEDTMIYLGNDIILDEDGKYVAEQFHVKGIK